jgi:hypothetical protein
MSCLDAPSSESRQPPDPGFALTRDIRNPQVRLIDRFARKNRPNMGRFQD